MKARILIEKLEDAIARMGEDVDCECRDWDGQFYPLDEIIEEGTVILLDS